MPGSTPSAPALTDYDAMFGQGANPNDLHFQFKVIEQLSESIRTQTNLLQNMQDQMRKMQEQQFDMIRRLDRIEAKEIDERVSQCLERIDALEAERQRREGAHGVVMAILKSPTLGWMAGAAATAWAVLTGKINI